MWPTRNANRMSQDMLNPETGGVIGCSSRGRAGREFKLANRIDRSCEALDPRCDTHEKKARILLVEDEDTTARSLVRILERLGYAVAHVSTLERALIHLPWPPHAVFLDLSLPDGSGIDVLRTIREQSLNISVAVTTGNVEEQALDEVKSLTPNALFGKPLRLLDLMDWLHGVTGHGGTGAALRPRRTEPD